MGPTPSAARAASTAARSEPTQVGVLSGAPLDPAWHAFVPVMGMLAGGLAGGRIPAAALGPAVATVDAATTARTARTDRTARTAGDPTKGPTWCRRHQPVTRDRRSLARPVRLIVTVVVSPGTALCGVGDKHTR